MERCSVEHVLFNLWSGLLEKRSSEKVYFFKKYYSFTIIALFNRYITTECINLLISELLTIIIEKFLPWRYERYVEMNKQFSSEFKKYQNEIPSYLWNRPRIIVEDILNKMKQVSPAMIESVQLYAKCIANNILSKKRLYTWY